MSDTQKLKVLSTVLFQHHGFHGVREPDGLESTSLLRLLSTHRGTCVTLVILYLAVADRVGLKLDAAATPDHLFVRQSGPGGDLNVEVLEGGAFVFDATYRIRTPIADQSIARGIFLTPLPRLAVLAHLLSNRGVLASRAGDYKSALKEFGSSLQLDPELVAAYYNRGLTYLALKRYEAAKDDFSRAVELHPVDAQAFNNRGIANQMLNDVDAARADFEQALRLRPTLREARENLGRLHSIP